jgi:hypothetical protein
MGIFAKIQFNYRDVKLQRTDMKLERNETEKTSPIIVTIVHSTLRRKNVVFRAFTSKSAIYTKLQFLFH